MSARDDSAMQALSDAGAQCGVCGDQPGDRVCPDCERHYEWCVAALRKAGWAPHSEVLGGAADAIALDRDATIPGGGKGAYRRGMTRAVDLLRRMAAAGQAGTDTAPSGETTQAADPASPDLHTAIYNAIRTFQVKSQQLGGYDQQLTEHLVTALTPLEGRHREAVAEALRLLEAAHEAFQPAPSQNITAAAGVLRRAHELGGGE